MREVERLEALAVVGSATVGPLRLRTPGLLWAAPDSGSRATPVLVSRASPPGLRALALEGEGGVLDLDFPIEAPETFPGDLRPRRVGAGAWAVHAPVAPEALAALRAERPDLVALANARALWNEGRALVRAIGELRRGLGARPLLWAPRVGLPHRLPWLAYVGIDLTDTTEGEIAAARGQYLDPTLGALDGPAPSARPCDCAACTGSDPIDLAAHARIAFRRALGELRAAAGRGRLRELVEARLAGEPALAEMLRYTDRDLADLLESRTPVTGAGLRNYVVLESFRRPEMVRFRSRLRERYRPPPSKSVLLLVPCSKTKPYRLSPSHRRMAHAIEELPRRERVHLVSVSSPIGVVPRELEDVPPARHYDIPVTGDWNEVEREAVTAGVAHLLASGRYRSVVVHLDREEYGFLEPTLERGPPHEWTDAEPADGGPAARLRAAVAAALAEAEPVGGGPLAVVREELQEVAAVQFGRSAAEALFRPPVRLAGRPWAQRVTDGRQDLATLREERGLFQLTTAGAERLGPALGLRVEVDPGLSLAGDLFVPGVRSASAEIRIGDAVGLYRGARLAGVGEAVLPGPLMTELERGLAVRVRHRHHPATDTAMTEEPPREEEGPVVQR